MVQRVDDAACGGGNGGNAGTGRFFFQPCRNGRRRKCYALCQPFCVRGTGKALRLSGTCPAAWYQLLHDAVPAGDSRSLHICPTSKSAVFAERFHGTCGAAHGTASAAGQSECLPERLLQCSVPRDCNSRLRCGGISAPCGNPHRTAPVAWGHQTGTGLHRSGVQHGVRHTVYGGHTDSAVLSEAGTLRRNVQPVPVAVYPAGSSCGSGRLSDCRTQHCQ